MGLTLYGRGKYHEAIDWYDKALKIIPSYAKALEGKQLSLEKLEKNTIENKDHLENGNGKIQSEETIKWNKNGDSLYLSKRYEEALGCYEKALAADPNDVLSLVNNGETLRNLCRYDEAIECYDKVLQGEPNDVKALNNKGVALFNLRRYGEAIEYYAMALKVEPNYELASTNRRLAFDKIKELTRVKEPTKVKKGFSLDFRTEHEKYYPMHLNLVINQCKHA